MPPTVIPNTHAKQGTSFLITSDDICKSQHIRHSEYYKKSHRSLSVIFLIINKKLNVNISTKPIENGLQFIYLSVYHYDSEYLA